MKQVGVYEAKTQLPRLLDEVERGESVTITRHGRPVARLVPLRGRRRIVADIWILEMVNGLLVGERRGRLTPADVALVSAELAELAIESSEVTLDQALGPVLE